MLKFSCHRCLLDRCKVQHIFKCNGDNSINKQLKGVEGAGVYAMGNGESCSPSAGGGGRCCVH